MLQRWVLSVALACALLATRGKLLLINRIVVYGVCTFDVFLEKCTLFEAVPVAIQDYVLV